MKRLLIALLIISLSIVKGIDTYSQVRKTKAQSSAKNNSKKFYVTLKLKAGYSTHLPIALYSKIGVDARISCHLSTQNVYMAEELITSDPFTRLEWCKLYSLDGKFLGYISKKNIWECKAPIAPQFEMVHVKGATFMMGDNKDPDASPEHPVSVSDFEICKYEVTPKQWDMIFGGKGIKHYSWNDVQNFIIILNKLTKKNYRLPTEAEWEYAAKGGRLGNGYKYSGSDTASVVAWHSKNSDFVGDAKMVEPGYKKPNELGIYDMSGNLWEYCQDNYNYYSDEPQTNPICKSSRSGFESYRIIRGGGIDDVPEKCSTTYRGKTPSDWVNRSCGFRLVLSSPQQNRGTETKK